MNYPIDYEIGISLLPNIGEIANENFTMTVLSSMETNMHFSLEIFYASMLLAVSKMTVDELKQFMIEFGEKRDLLQRQIVLNG